ncbi:ABC transporter permease [Fonticella tunisiensis]|uniref:Putative ABC transport system permease protein n=1 Tax=Fonticella tunisiensis TaxID=1096341 RepID=A0A4R7KVN7_9CLOT|nr:FtsX-like permease family protein [Fonticella tunisiensis]TDT62453.1 putative ABC transport system permease protein [Fonticella tunisiensis]
MIKGYSEITGKYLRANKKRTILTLIGIILSVSLISAIGFFLKSMQEAQIQDVKNTYGSWHVMYKRADDSLITKIKSNPIVLRSGTYATGDTVNINDKFKVREVFGSDDGLELLPYKLKEGRFPKTNTEAAVERWFLDKIKADGKLGDKIKILDKEYTLVGILSDTYRNQNDGIGELVTNDPNANKDQRILLVELNPNRKLMENIDELKKLSDEKSIEENRMLIMAQGETMPEGMIFTAAVIIGIVVISTIAVIYNAFQISVVERVKQFGLLRAVGATPKQIRKIILREAAFLASIGIPMGLGFGIVALYGIDFTFKLIGGENIVIISPRISIDVMLISILIGLVSIYVSALLPAIFAGRISPLVAISSRNSIIKEKLKRRKSHIMGRIFGFEGALASKNIKRNRKRYRITVFSIVISVTLFITFKAFMDMSLNVYSEMNESRNIHFSVVTGSNDGENAGVEESIIENINRLPYTDVSYRVFNSYYFDAVIDKTRELKDIKDIGNIYNDINYNGENKTLMGASLVVYDDKSLEVAKKYLKEGKIDIERLNRENGVIIIGKNRVYNQKTEKIFYGPVTDLKAGDEILLQLNEARYDTSKKKVDFGQGRVNKVKVLAVLEGNPFTFRGDEMGIKMITTKDVAERLTSKSINPIGLNIKIKDVKLESEAKKDIQSIINNGNNLKLINFIDQNRTSKAAILMIKILLYGFVVVVSLIGSVNIINTLTTNIILRRREFAALKSIGLTQRGLRKMIILEGILYGMMGSIYGSVFGSLLSYLLYRGISDVREQSYKFPLDSILIAAIGVMLIGYLSVLAPIRRMKKDNLIDAIREDF